jgi:hypothetical protein
LSHQFPVGADDVVVGFVVVKVVDVVLFDVEGTMVVEVVV